MAGKTTKKAAAKKTTVKKPAKGGKETAAKRAAAKPTLLAGGNPQIANEDGQFDETQMAAWVRQAAALPGWVTAQAAKPRKAVAPSSAHMSASKRIDKAIADLGDWRGERLAEIRTLIHEVDPDVVEEWKWMGSPVWSHEGMYAVANAHKDKVKLTFHHGAQLPDPKKLFNAGLSGNKWRAIDFRAGDKIDKTALKALLREAVAYNATHSVPKSKGSRAILL